MLSCDIPERFHPGGWPSGDGVGILGAVAKTVPVPALTGESAKRPGRQTWTPRRPFGAGNRVTGVEINIGRLLVVEQALGSRRKTVGMMTRSGSGSNSVERAAANLLRVRSQLRQLMVEECRARSGFRERLPRATFRRLGWGRIPLV